MLPDLFRLAEGVQIQEFENSCHNSSSSSTLIISWAVPGMNWRTDTQSLLVNVFERVFGWTPTPNFKKRKTCQIIELFLKHLSARLFCSSVLHNLETTLASDFLRIKKIAEIFSGPWTNIANKPRDFQSFELILQAFIEADKPRK